MDKKKSMRTQTEEMYSKKQREQRNSGVEKLSQDERRRRRLMVKEFGFRKRQ